MFLSSKFQFSEYNFIRNVSVKNCERNKKKKYTNRMSGREEKKYRGIQLLNSDRVCYYVHTYILVKYTRISMLK